MVLLAVEGYDALIFTARELIGVFLLLFGEVCGVFATYIACDYKLDNNKLFGNYHLFVITGLVLQI